jgi:hypothetical protein
MGRGTLSSDCRASAIEEGDQPPSSMLIPMCVPPWPPTAPMNGHLCRQSAWRSHKQSPIAHASWPSRASLCIRRWSWPQSWRPRAWRRELTSRPCSSRQCGRPLASLHRARTPVARTPAAVSDRHKPATRESAYSGHLSRPAAMGVVAIYRPVAGTTRASRSLETPIPPGYGASFLLGELSG